MRKKTLFQTISILTILTGLFWQTATADNIDIVQDKARRAIEQTRYMDGYGIYTLPSKTATSTTVWLLDYEVKQFEADFVLLITNTYKASPNNNAFLTTLALENTNWENRFLDTTIAWRERAKNKMRSYIYKNFLTIWNGWVFTTPAPPVYNPGRTFTEIQDYTTLNGKRYTIRKSNDNLYRFRKNDGRYFKTLSAVTMYIEIQNRTIYTAPNQRRYGIFRIQWRFYFNRDEWSVSTLSRRTYNDTIAYINQHNQPVPWCEIVSERRCY